MNILIIEDEKPALERLIKTIKKIDSSIIIKGTCSSVSESIKWLGENPVPELILLDIQLTDGSSFEILKKCNVTCPVIFITAYDEYFFGAFEYNSIDYLLKPVKQEKLEHAIKKYAGLKKHFTVNFNPLLQQLENSKKERMLVKKGIEFISVKTGEIAYFYTEHKIVFLIDNSGNRYIVDKPLSVLEEELDKKIFFRVNRKYLININSVKKFRGYNKGKILLEIYPSVNEEVVVSQENASVFKRWLDR